MLPLTCAAREKARDSQRWAAGREGETQKLCEDSKRGNRGWKGWEGKLGLLRRGIAAVGLASSISLGNYFLVHLPFPINGSPKEARDIAR